MTTSIEFPDRTLRGVRFAPSPTGRFHIGNLRTAWISEQLARQLEQPWVIRVEDLDPLRSKTQFWTSQEGDLQRLGLRPDEVHWQRERLAKHREALQQAYLEARIYPCNCSRREVLDGLASAPHGAEAIYNGKCRRNPVQQLDENVGWRWKLADEDGRHDSLIARGDLDEAEPAYHWACALDDADGGYQLLVRAIDLLPAERIQRAIRLWRRPHDGGRILVFHTSLVVHDNDARLEKRSQGVTLDELPISVDQLINNFDHSFDRSAAQAALEGARVSQSKTPPLLQEAASQIRVSELIKMI